MSGHCGGAGATAHLDLAFRHHAVRGTWLERRMFRWPYTLARGFRLDAALPDMLTLILQTASGAIHANDRLVQRVAVGPHAAVHITTPGATPVHRAHEGMSAEDDIALVVADGGCIEYMPELRILFPGASYFQRVHVQLPASATAIVADGFVMHDPHGKDGAFRQYRSGLHLLRPDGSLLVVDQVALDAPPRSAGRRARYVCYGNLFIASCQPASWLERLCADVDARIAAVPGSYAAVSELPNGAGVMVRVAAIDGRHLRLGLQAAWRAARLHLFGREPALSRP